MFSRWVAPPAPAAATAIGPRNTRLMAQRNNAHFSRRPTETVGNQSSHHPSPARRPGNLGASRGRLTKEKKSHSSSRKRSRPTAGDRLLPASSTIGLVQLAGGLLKLAAQQGGRHRPASVDDLHYPIEFVLARGIQHEGGYVLSQPQRTRMAYADAQAPEIRTGKRGLYVA